MPVLCVMAAADQVSNSEIADALRRARELANSNDSAKRPLSNDTETHNGNPSKRINNHDDNNLESMSGGNPITSLSSVASMEPVLVENFQVPDNCVGLIIGRGGENITNIQNESGCKIQMSNTFTDSSTGKPMRACSLTGTQTAIEKARSQLNQIIEKSGGTMPPAKNGSIGGGGGGMMQSSPGGGGGGTPMMGFGGKMVTVELQIPGTKCGLIIGKGGETIKQLQERAGVKMVMIQESNQVTSGYKPLRIIGEPEKIEHAKRLVEEVINSKDDKMPSFMMNDYGSMGGGGGIKAGQSVGEVIVPRTAVGVIIGKSGETIRRLTLETGAKIQFKPDNNLPERTALIMGTTDQIRNATLLITDLVNRAVAQDQNSGGNMMTRLGNADSADVFYMHVPANKTGLVIGKGGETIKQISAESGARVELSRDPPPSDTEKVFVIRGSPYQIHHAQHLIRIKVGDVQQGAPVPPFTGGGSAMTAEPQYSYPGMAQQAPASTGDQNSAWAAYYAQQYYQTSPATPYGTTFATSAASVAPSAAPQPAAAVATAPSSAPSINPQTGQPDYSAQWAQYYRSLGLHDQAALIEEQARANQAASQRAVQPTAQQAFQAAYGHQQQAAQPYSYGQPATANSFQYATPQY